MDQIAQSYDKNIDRRITKIIAARKRGKCFLCFNDDSSILIERDLIFEYELSKNRIVSQAFLQDILHREELINAKKVGLSFATYALRTEKQVRLKLRDSGFGELIITQVIDFLKDFNYLSDEVFAENFIKAKINRKYYGYLRLKRQLSDKGVNEHIINSYLPKYYTQDIALETARKSAERKLRSISFREEKKKKTQVKDHLFRQGFSLDIIQIILKELF
ncbi:MAG: RecX family transcriptional regulator [Ignavibacteriae bacterium]|nr:RecX family transcriptional regulator [Ignavibacteriota bacterium]